MYRVFINGFLTGFVLQLALGPIFFYITGITLSRTLYDGLAAMAAVTLADYMFILLALAGVGKLLENEKYKKIFGIISSLVILIFGAYMLSGAINPQNSGVNDINAGSDIIKSFSTAFLLTVSSPLTIVFWSGIFVAKSIEYRLTGRQLIVFGIAAGFSTIVFLSLTVIIISVFKSSIPDSLVIVLNISVGIVLILYGIYRFYKSSVETHCRASE